MRILPSYLALAMIVVSASARGVEPPPEIDALTLLQELESERRVQESNQKIDEIKLRRAEIARELGDTAGPSGFPTLIRLVGVPGKEIAEFEHGNTRFEARVGDAVTPEYRIVRTFATAVELQSREGTRQLLMMGSSNLSPSRTVTTQPPLSRTEPTPLPPPAAVGIPAGQGSNTP